ncbi:MAG: LysM peptidoglycan-binding domain-containing protein [Myxococcales bacterium]|nr:LysM peptidoglycan-binding domain-containing protein [Myxococcales bacterium]
MRHKIVMGDTLSGIAYKYGIKSWKTIWDADDNESFRERCGNNYDKIFPGDTVFIPSVRESTVTKSGSGTSTSTTKPATTKPATTKPATTKPATTKPSTSPAKPPATATTSTTKAAAKKEPEYSESNTHKGIMKTAEILKCSAAALPKYIEFLVRVTGASVDEIGEALEFLGKRADGLEFIVESYKAYVSFESGKVKDGCVSLLKAIGKGWKAMPKAFQDKCVRGLTRILRRIPKLEDVGDMLVDLHRYHVVPHMVLLLAAILDGKAGDARNATKDLMDGLKDHPTAITLSYNMCQFFLKLLPDSIKTKLMARMAGRKIPLFGTAIVAVTDIISIWQAETDAESTELDKWIARMGLASTGAGLFPGAGTALSVVIDLAIIIMTCIEELNTLNIVPKNNPTK